jgi:hypothetical protein
VAGHELVGPLAEDLVGQALALVAVPEAGPDVAGDPSGAALPGQRDEGLALELVQVRGQGKHECSLG